MTIVYIFIVLTAIYLGAKYLNNYIEDRKDRKRFGVAGSELESLSFASQQVMEQYMALPTANRPAVDMLSIVKALDVKGGGVDKVDNHLSNRRRMRGNDGYSWDNCSDNGYRRSGQDHPRCICHEHRSLYDTMVDIGKALEEQEHALELAGLSGQLDTARALVDQMRDEAKMVRDITKQITT